MQEPGTNEEIKEFAQKKYNAKYDLFSKINVNGDGALNLFKWMKSQKYGKGTLTKYVLCYVSNCSGRNSKKHYNT